MFSNFLFLVNELGKLKKTINTRQVELENSMVYVHTIYHGQVTQYINAQIYNFERYISQKQIVDLWPFTRSNFCPFRYATWLTTLYILDYNVKLISKFSCVKRFFFFFLVKLKLLAFQCQESERIRLFIKIGISTCIGFIELDCIYVLN